MFSSMMIAAIFPKEQVKVKFKICLCWLFMNIQHCCVYSQNILSFTEHAFFLQDSKTWDFSWLLLLFLFIHLWWYLFYWVMRKKVWRKNLIDVCRMYHFIQLISDIKWDKTFSWFYPKREIIPQTSLANFLVTNFLVMFLLSPQTSQTSQKKQLHMACEKLYKSYLPTQVNTRVLLLFYSVL